MCDYEGRKSKGILPKQIRGTEGFCCLSGEEFSQNKMALRVYFLCQKFGLNAIRQY